MKELIAEFTAWQWEADGSKFVATKRTDYRSVQAILKKIRDLILQLV